MDFINLVCETQFQNDRIHMNQQETECCKSNVKKVSVFNIIQRFYIIFK
jgi:hypothetical protein